MKNFIKNMLSSKDDISSKRVMGILCIILFCLLLAASVFTGKIKIDNNQQELLTTMFYGGISLLGLGLIEKFKKL